jgi:isopenicillin-N N-acyltransferase-like protein
MTEDAQTQQQMNHGDSSGSSVTVPGSENHAHFELEADTFEELGRVRGELLRDRLSDTYEQYAALFRAFGVSEADEKHGAESCLKAIERWRPGICAELTGIADAAKIDELKVAALNARTEILSLGSSPAGTAAHECSSVAGFVGDSNQSIQTWDWHTELNDYWHTHDVRGPGYRFVGLTENGIVGKIGMNSEGLAVHFNILSSAEDSARGVPMHVLARVILAEAQSVEEALQIIESAEVHSSSALTLLDTEEVVSVEISPVLSTAIEPVGGYVVRTNHFQDEQLAQYERGTYLSDSIDRFTLLQNRLTQRAPTSNADLLKLMTTGPDEAAVCCVHDADAVFGDRMDTLATVMTNPLTQSIRIQAGSPAHTSRNGWREFTL